MTGGGFTGAGNLFTPYAGATNTALAEQAASAARDAVAGDLVTTNQVKQAATSSGTFGSNIKDAFTPGGKTFSEAMGDAFFPKTTLNVGGKTLTNPTTADVLTAGGIKNPLTATTAQQTAAATMIKEAAPGILRTYGPLAAAGTALAAGSGMFTPSPAEPAGVVARDAEGNAITGADLIAQDPGRYLVSDLGNIVLNPDTGQYETRSVGPIGDLNPVYQMPTSYSVPTTFAANIQSPYLRESNAGGPFARP